MKNIKDVYKEVEDKKENEISDKKITMSIDDFIDEHKNLIKVLLSGDKKSLEREAAIQAKELKEKTGIIINNKNEDDD